MFSSVGQNLQSRIFVQFGRGHNPFVRNYFNLDKYQGMCLKGFILFLLWWPFCSMEWSYLWNFERGHYHTQGAEVTGQLRVNDKVRHLQRCTLQDQSLALKRKHRVHKYVNTAAICVYVMNLFILT